MIALIKSWIDRLREYEGESIDYLTIALCFIQCWSLQYNSAARDAENVMKGQADASTSCTKPHPRNKILEICFEDPIRGQQRRIVQFHKAQIAQRRAKIRVWFFNAIRSSRRETARQELLKTEKDYNWVMYDWFSVARPIPLPLGSHHSVNGADYSAQYQSQFFQLPAEIRQLIYTAHLSGITISLVVQQAGKYSPGYESRAYLDWARLEREGRTHFTPTWRQSRMPHKGRHLGFMYFGIVDFLLTCKRMYVTAGWKD